jgi:hypothetical protein
MDSRRGRIAAALTAAFLCVMGAGTAHALSPPILDTTPPVVPVPALVGLDENTRTATLSAPATDDRGVRFLSYTWTAGDGTPPRSTRTGQFVHVYPALGTFTGTVTVADRAGNRTTQPFTVAVVDHTAPRLGYMLVDPAVLAKRALRVVLAPTEPTTALIGAHVRAAGHTYRLPVARRPLFPNRFTGVRFPVRREVRQAIARALRRHLPVSANVSVAIADSAGNGSTAAGFARITG